MKNIVKVFHYFFTHSLLFRAFLLPMKALGLDYKTFGLKEFSGPFGSKDFLRVDAIEDNLVKGPVLRLIRQTAESSYKARAGIFTPHTRDLYNINAHDDVTHRRILREQNQALNESFEDFLGTAIEHPQTFLWAATFFPPFMDSSGVKVSDLLRFHQIQAEVASEEGIPIYYGTIGSKREAFAAAIAASRGDVPEVTIGFVVDNDGKLLHDHTNPSNVISAISERLQATFGFDHCSLQGAQAAFTDLQDHKLQALFKAFFPYPDDTQNAWEAVNPDLVYIHKPADLASQVIELAQRFGVIWTGYSRGASASDLTTFTSILRGSQKNRILIPERPDPNNNCQLTENDPPFGISDTLPANPPEIISGKAYSVIPPKS